MSSTAVDSRSIGGLSHLVEAASALSRLADIENHQQQQQQQQLEQQQFVLSTSPLPVDDSLKTNLVVSDDEEDAYVQSKHGSVTSKDIFPQRLFEILEGEYSDVISWLPHGRSFIIIRPDVFSDEVLPRFYGSSDSRSNTKYPSFTRKLNRWGFRQATKGPDTGAFFHPLFRRDKPGLCMDMVCQKSRKRTSPPKNTNVRESVKPSIEAACQKHLQSNTCFSKLTKETLSTLPTSEPHNHCKTISVDSTDDARLSPPLQSSPGHMPTLCSVPCGLLMPGAPMPPSPWVPTDPVLVAKALRDREELEKLTIAKSMLYQAFLDAMRK
jgi:hypothetical protein